MSRERRATKLIISKLNHVSSWAFGLKTLPFFLALMEWRPFDFISAVFNLCEAS